MSNYGADVDPDMAKAAKLAYSFRFMPTRQLQYEQFSIDSTHRVMKVNSKRKIIQIKFLVDPTLF